MTLRGDRIDDRACIVFIGYKQSGFGVGKKKKNSGVYSRKPSTSPRKTSPTGKVHKLFAIAFQRRAIRRRNVIRRISSR